MSPLSTTRTAASFFYLSTGPNSPPIANADRSRAELTLMKGRLNANTVSAVFAVDGNRIHRPDTTAALGAETTMRIPDAGFAGFTKSPRCEALGGNGWFNTWPRL